MSYKLSARYLMSGINSEQMRLMTVLRILIGPVILPLLQMTVSTYMIGTQPADVRITSFGKNRLRQFK